jgi:hypothetical protein
LDYSPDSDGHRGSYKLTVTEASKEDASKVLPGTGRPYRPAPGTK